MAARDAILRCPRCGYDQSGVVARWQAGESCPLASPCSECGFEIIWRNVFRPTLERVPWLFEHARGPVRSFVAAWRTFFRIPMPRRFWRDIQLDHRVSVRRLLLWPLVIIGSLHVTLMFAVACRIAWYFGVTLPNRPAGRFFRPTFEFEYLLRTWAQPVVARHPFYTWNSGSGETSVSWLREWHVLPDWPVPIVTAFGFTIGFPAFVLIMPISRRLARVRAAHVLRASIYPFGWLALIWLGITGNFLADLLGFGALTWRNGQLGFPLGRKHLPATLVITTLIMIWLSFWWLIVIRDHWRMERPTLVWLAAMAGAIVVAAAAGMGWSVVEILR